MLAYPLYSLTSLLYMYFCYLLAQSFCSEVVIISHLFPSFHLALLSSIFMSMHLITQVLSSIFCFWLVHLSLHLWKTFPAISVPNLSFSSAQALLSSSVTVLIRPIIITIHTGTHLHGAKCALVICFGYLCLLECGIMLLT